MTRDVNQMNRIWVVAFPYLYLLDKYSPHIYIRVDIYCAGIRIFFNIHRYSWLPTDIYRRKF